MTDNNNTDDINNKIDLLVEQLARLALENRGKKQRFIVGLAGIPAGGKTYVTARLVKRVNEKCRAILEQSTTTAEQITLCTSLPMDGFHHLRHTLSNRKTALNNIQPGEKYTFTDYQTKQRDLANELFNTPYQTAVRQREENIKDDELYFIDGEYRPWPGAELAYAKRGAAFTFDPFLLCFALNNIKYKIIPDKQIFPGWDHAKKDPSYDEPIILDDNISLVIVEGLYVLLNVEPWYTLLHTNTTQTIQTIPQPLDSTALIDAAIILHCPEELTIQRGAVRNWKAGITETLEQSIERWCDNDIKNGQMLMANMIKPNQGPQLRWELDQEDANAL